MPAIQRIGDKNTGGGAVLNVPQSSVSANNILIAINTSQVSGHGYGKHKRPNTANGSTTVSINNKPVNKTGDLDTCGHSRASGSNNVSVN